MTGGELALLSAAVLVAATVQTVSGFGFALLGVPLIALAADARTAVLVTTVLGAVTSLTQTAQSHREVAWRDVRLVLIPAILAMPLGLVVFEVASETVLRVAVGLAVLVTVVLLIRHVDLRHVGPGLERGAGLTSGVLATSTGTNGPPVVFVLQARRLPPEVFRPTVATILGVSSLVSVLGFAIVGAFDADVLLALLAGLPALALGILLGIRLRGHVPAERFRHLVIALLTAGAVSVLVSALV